MKEKNGEHPLGDAGQLIVLGLFIVIWVVDSFFLHKTTAISDFVPLYARLAILILFVVVSLYLFRSGHVVVSHDHRPNQVVSSGAFRYVRHPLYLGSILMCLGLSISTCSIASFGFLVVIIAFYDYIASYEEGLLEIKFGEEYRNYKRATGKWMPRFGPMGQPD